MADFKPLDSVKLKHNQASSIHQTILLSSQKKLCKAPLKEDSK